MANFCDKCGTKLEPKNRFCPACGKPVHSSEYAPAQMPAQAQNTQYPVRHPQQPKSPQHTQYTNQSKQTAPQHYNKPEKQPEYKPPYIQQAQQKKPNLQKPDLQKQPQHSQSQTLPQYGQQQSKSEQPKPQTLPQYGQQQSKSEQPKPQTLPQYGQQQSKSEQPKPQTLPQYGQQQSSSRQSNPQPLPQYGQQYTSNTRQHSSSGSGGLTFLIIMLAILLAAECLIACLWYPGFISPWVFPENKSTVVNGNIDELPSEFSDKASSEFDAEQNNIF